eukprot:scaffold237_cov421-Prasinococcus_capsulatus_cf.AAC.4
MIPRLWVLLVHAICGYADIVSDHPELFCSEPNSCELQVGQSACCNKNLKCADFMDGGVCTGKVYESTDTEYGFCFCDDVRRGMCALPLDYTYSRSACMPVVVCSSAL